MLYLSEPTTAAVECDGAVGGKVKTKALPTPAVEEDEVDKLLVQKDGKIYRKRDLQL